MEKSKRGNNVCYQSKTDDKQQTLCEASRNSDSSGIKQFSKVSSQTVKKLYVSRALSAWGSRIWAFSLGVFINKLYPDSLRVVAIYGFVVSVSLIIFGASVGKWIDQNRRWLAAKVCLLVENLSVILSYVLLVLYYTFWIKIDESRWIVITSVILISILANLASTGCKIIIEKDWVVVITEGNETQLAATNAVFTTIDLTAMVLSPMFSGFLFHLANPEIVALVIGIWNFISIFIEYYLLKSIYHNHPELAMKKVLKPLVMDTTKKSSSYCPCSIDKPWISSKYIGTGWKSYMNHNVRDAGLGLAFLYMTVLGFDNITYGFCLSQCVTEGLLGILVGVSAFIGILGSLSFPYIRKRLGLARTGLIGMGSLIIADLLCVMSIWLDGSPFDPQNSGKDEEPTERINDNDLDFSTLQPNLGDTNNSTFSQSEELSDCQISSFLSVSILLSGILLAKFGLWISDLTIMQTLQEEVEEENRGVINGVQNSINSLMETIKFSLVVSLPGEKTFGFLIIASFISIVCGAVSYTKYASNPLNRKRREELQCEEWEERREMLEKLLN